jgi:thiamine kinase-like enzyme
VTNDGRIDEVVGRVSLWDGAGDLTVTPLPGGLTNQNFIVEADGAKYVVRIPGPRTELLAVDRRNERHNAEAAATTGISPPVLEYLEDLSVMVIPYIDGETMAAETLRSPEMPTRMAASLRRLHSAPRFLRDFDMFRTTEYYLGIVAEHDVRIPEGYREHLGALDDVERALAINALPPVPCHNDLLGENYIDDGKQLWIVDFEYSGNNDPCFELGDTAQECGFDDRLRSALCEAYFGNLDPVQRARMDLFALMADVGWTLWAAIQANISTIDFDFWSWAVERWERAATLMDSARFGTLVRDAER